MSLTIIENRDDNRTPRQLWVYPDDLKQESLSVKQNELYENYKRLRIPMCATIATPVTIPIQIPSPTTSTSTSTSASPAPPAAEANSSLLSVPTLRLSWVTYEQSQYATTLQTWSYQLQLQLVQLYQKTDKQQEQLNQQQQLQQLLVIQLEVMQQQILQLLQQQPQQQQQRQEQRYPVSESQLETSAPSSACSSSTLSSASSNFSSDTENFIEDLFPLTGNTTSGLDTTQDAEDWQPSLYEDIFAGLPPLDSVMSGHAPCSDQHLSHDTNSQRPSQ
jgi:hypothetical protein